MTSPLSTRNIQSSARPCAVPENKRASPWCSWFGLSERRVKPCSQPMKSGGFVLVKREDDGWRTCRRLLRCAGLHVWWRRADRPEGPLETCPMPELFR